MTRHVWPLFVLSCACGGSTIGTEPPAPPPPPPEAASAPIASASPPSAETTEAPPAPAKPPPMQIVTSELAKAGWECQPLSTDTPTLQCPAGANHPVAMRVTYSNADPGCTNDDPCFLRLDSYDAPRAFGTPCEKFEDAMNDLRNAAHHFSVTCNDTTTDPMTTQTFGFTTTLTVTEATSPGVAAVLPIHQADRSAAIQKLVSIKAIRRPKATGSGEKHDVAR